MYTNHVPKRPPVPTNLLRSFGQLAERLDPTPDPYKDKPAEWVRDKLREHFWSKQVEIGMSVVNNRYTAVRSCHGSGKSYSASRLVGWWLDTHEDAFVVTSAPTTSQIGAILWREIRLMQERGNLEGRTTLDNQWYHGQHLVAFGRKPADYADPEKAKASFQGIHARNVLVILDEAAGIPKWLWEAVDSLVTNANSRVLAIGNPDDPASEFARVCSPGSGYNVIGISAFDTPAFTGEPIPTNLYEVLVSQLWVEERAKKWGEESPYYIAKVLGQFPEISDDTLISPKLIAEAIARDLGGEGTYGPGTLAADIARKGEDRTVVYRNRGGVIRKEDAWGKMSTMRTAGRLQRILRRHALNIPMVIDGIGIGAGVYDRLKEQGMPVTAFISSRKADPMGHETEDYRNKRSQQWWAFRKMFEDGLVDLDPHDEDLHAELVSIKWHTNSGGKIVVENKELTVKRIGRSPDNADAAMMTTVKADQWRDFVQDRIAGVGRERTNSLTDDLLGKEM